MTTTTTIKLRRGTSAQWSAANPVLAAGEPGYETDTGRHKIGDGTSPWANLPHFQTARGANLARFIERCRAGRPVKIVANGDSVLEGTTVTSGGGVLGTDDVLSLVGTQTAARFGNTVTTSNRAQSGHTVAMQQLSLTWNAAVGDAGDLYLVGWRANDSAAARYSTPVPGYPVDAFAAGLERYFRRIRTDVPKADIAFLIYGEYNSARSTPENAAMATYEKRARDVCAAYGVEVIDARAAFRDADGTSPKGSLYSDSIHPNKAGHAALADVVMRHLPASWDGPTRAPAQVPVKGMFSPEKVNTGTGDTGADQILAPAAGIWVETGSWSDSGSARTTTTPGDKITITRNVTEAFAMVDTSTGANLHATVKVDGVEVITNKAFDARPLGMYWVPLATGLAPGNHTVELILVSGTLTVDRVGWLAGSTGGYNSDIAHVVLGADATLTQVPTSGTALTPLPSGSVYLDLPSGWTTADVYLRGWAEYRITGATTSVRTIRTRVIVDGTDRRDAYVTSAPVSENTFLHPVQVDCVIEGLAHHKLVALNMTLTSTDKTLTYLKAYRLEAMLVRRS